MKGWKEAVGDVDWMAVGPHEEIAFDDGHQVLLGESTVARGAVGRLGAVLLLQLLQPSIRSENRSRKYPDLFSVTFFVTHVSKLCIKYLITGGYNHLRQ